MNTSFLPEADGVENRESFLLITFEISLRFSPTNSVKYLRARSLACVFPDWSRRIGKYSCLSEEWPKTALLSQLYKRISRLYKIHDRVEIVIKQFSF